MFLADQKIAHRLFDNDTTINAFPNGQGDETDTEDDETTQPLEEGSGG